MIETKEELEGLSENFNHVILTAPPDIIPHSLTLLRYGGSLVYIGFGNGASFISFDANDFHVRKLQLKASFARPSIYYPSVLELLKNNMIPESLIISDRFHLSEIKAAMEKCRYQKSEVVKVVVTP